MAFTRCALALCALLAASQLAAAHYNIKSPKPYNPIDCNPKECMGPCPPIWSRGKAKARNSPSNPSAVWSRGDVVDIEWHRNNHEGGFYRRALVPVKYMNDHAWHKKLAFDWGCWTQGRYQCGSKQNGCGTDQRGFAYRNKMTVPKVFPDGDYVFAMVWYGGLHWQRKRGFFSDYFTCSYVKIQGGPLANEHTPTFTPGKNHRSSVPPGKCVSHKQFIGECGGEECPNNPVYTGLPGVFSNGRTPPKVLLKDLNSGAVVPESQSESVLKMAPIEEEKKALEKVEEEKKVDAELVNEQKKAEGDPLTWKKGSSNSQPSPTPSRSPPPPPQTVNMQPMTEQNSGVEMWMGVVVPQWPTGTWGVKNSALYNSQRAKWWARSDFCKKYKTYPNCWDQDAKRGTNTQPSPSPSSASASSTSSSSSNSNAPSTSNSGVQMWMGKVVPQWPTGTWGLKNSALYNSQRAKWWARQDFCKEYKTFPNCWDGK